MKVGDRVKVQKHLLGKPKGTYQWVKGRVVAVYPHMIIVDFGRYREGFNTADIVTREVQVI